MKDLIYSFNLSRRIFLKDKVCLLLSLIPVVIGIILYYWIGKWFYGPILTWGNELVADFITKDSLGTVVYYFFFGIISIFLYVLIGYTFTLVVSLIASPFNDFLSSRVEKILLGKPTSELNQGLKETIKKLLYILKEEVKKISVIAVLGLTAFAIGLIPMLAPISFFISAICLAIQFLDYTWCRKEMSFSACFKGLMAHLFSYSVSGALISLVMIVPILNLFCIPFAVIFFTILWSVKNEKSQIVSDLA